MANVSVKLNSSVLRWTVIVAMLLTLVLTFVFAKWFFAGTIAARAVYKEIAEFAVGLAPDDPQTHFSYGFLLDKTFLPDDLPKSVAEFEKAVALSPSDYRLWLELGKSRERLGDTAGAEKALRKSLELAPNYSRVQWALGNILLRQGKSEEAFVEIRKAAEGDKTFANPAVASAWQLFGGDLRKIAGYVGDSANLKAAFASVLAREKLFDEAVAVWLSVPETSRTQDFEANRQEIYAKMIEARRFAPALNMLPVSTEPNSIPIAAERISNGGLEGETPKNPHSFEWTIADGAEPQIGIDNTVRRSGNISLKLIFNNPDGKAFRTVSQTVVVKPGKTYIFETFGKAELKTTATVKWEIVDATDGKTILATTPAIAPSGDWNSLKAEFTAPASTEAVLIRLIRAPCGSPLCPVSGRVWFDDFSLDG